MQIASYLELILNIISYLSRKLRPEYFHLSYFGHAVTI